MLHAVAEEADLDFVAVKLLSNNPDHVNLFDEAFFLEIFLIQNKNQRMPKRKNQDGTSERFLSTETELEKADHCHKPRTRMTTCTARWAGGLKVRNGWDHQQ